MQELVDVSDEHGKINTNTYTRPFKETLECENSSHYTFSVYVLYHNDLFLCVSVTHFLKFQHIP